MKFIRPLTEKATQTIAASPNPLPLNEVPSPESERLIRLDDVARHLRVSRRYVQTLVRRKVIPVIRLGRRCTRFDLEAVLAAVRRFEIEEIGRHDDLVS